MHISKSLFITSAQPRKHKKWPSEALFMPCHAGTAAAALKLGTGSKKVAIVDIPAQACIRDAMNRPFFVQAPACNGHKKSSVGTLLVGGLRLRC